ncbi:DUF4405 domain-containing protein [Myxosarcina sp. GI1]|uniref:DUF4405 domain-containing protein n=1 Tax=Myxosarcina sp. GI1 TaxID=1541065 RepID=UPI0005615FD0|nr:DUF4405 domain-containing protein [Myxosarcina sp. GI1]
MARRRKIYYLNYLRAIAALALLVVWSFAALTGFLLELLLRGYGAGRLFLFLGLTRHQWGEIHFVVCVIALGVTVIHTLLEWRVLRGYIRYFFDPHHRPGLFK